MIVVRKMIFIAALSWLISGGNGGQAQACPFDRKQDFKVFQSAEVILVAKVVSYKAVASEYHAIFEFETIRMISGPGSYRNPPKRWRAEWTNSTFGEPAKWDAKVVIVGLGAKISRHGEAVLYVVQQSCSQPSIIPASEKNLRAILKDAGIHFHPDSPTLKNIPWP